ncbi:MAG: hypothetical protein WKG07_23965 [Hymenobacter sp.]
MLLDRLGYLAIVLEVFPEWHDLAGRDLHLLCRPVDFLAQLDQAEVPVAPTAPSEAPAAPCWAPDWM